MQQEESSAGRPERQSRCKRRDRLRDQNAEADIHLAVRQSLFLTEAVEKRLFSRLAEVGLIKLELRVLRRIWLVGGGLCPDRLKERLHAEDLDHSLHIVGQNVEAHLGSDLFERPGQEVGTAHPRLEGSEGVFDSLSPHAYGIWHAVETGLHFFEDVFMLPALKPL